jgi:DNA-binding PadR family transcriptional regulator
MNYLTLNEQVLLLAIWQLKENAYPVSIRDKVIGMTNKNIVYGTLYNSLDQLVKKGYVTSQKGEPSSERGGKRKVFFTLSDEGISALQHSKQFYETLWQGIDAFALNSRKE